MTPAFWDSSALVPLCVRGQASPVAAKLVRQHPIVVWWSTPVEMRSAFERLLRMEQLTHAEHAGAGKRLDRLRKSWREMQPCDAVRSEAEVLLARFPLKAADALQLAAALAWARGRPKSRAFISADAQLLDAARQLGFHTIEA